MTGKDPEQPQGLILRMQRMSTEDGPGIRSTVFFKGCPLRCVWCHNPESISASPQVHWTASRCIGCLSCVEACPEQALQGTDKGLAIDRRACTGCLRCIEACPSTAMEVYGRAYGVRELVDELVKDRAYFEKSGGGVTLSGGEPTLQAGFAHAVLEGLKDRGIHTALDTCGQCPWLTLEKLLPHTDVLLYDLKLMDPALHRRYTGQDGSRILGNLARLAELCRKTGIPGNIWVRTPVIPGHTDGVENIRAIGAFLRDTLGGAIARWELCAFNNLCIHKYEGLGIDWTCRRYPLVESEELVRLGEIASEAIGEPGIVRTTGAARAAGEGDQAACPQEKEADTALKWGET